VVQWQKDVGLHFMKEYPNFWEFQRTVTICNNPLKLRGQSYKRGLWFFVRLFEEITRGNGYVLSSCFYAL